MTNGSVLGPDGSFRSADLHIVGDRIVDDGPTAETEIDCTGLYVLPGMVDVHGDAFETMIYPRPGVRMDMPVAMASVDRQVLAHGITTAYHGLTVSWEPGARGLDAARWFMDGLRALKSKLGADHRVQLRWETYAHEAIVDVLRWLDVQPIPSIAFNDHATDTLEVIRQGDWARIEPWARRAGVNVDAYIAQARSIGERVEAVPGKISQVAEAARARGSVLLAHDEAYVQTREENRALGMTISEFPMSADVARDAVVHAEHVVMGAPNVLRGGSHKGNLSAEEAVRSGLCTILASDYYYPSLLGAVERLVETGIMPLEQAWSLVSSHPAEAMGLEDRGTVAPGKRADVVVVDSTGTWRVVHVLSGGVISSFGR